jgi:hypothetical protein
MRHTVTLEVEVTITTTDEGEAGIDRYVGLSPEAAKEWGMRPGLTKDALLVGLAISGVYGRSDANQDGYADLDRGSISVHIADAVEF